MQQSHIRMYTGIERVRSLSLGALFITLLVGFLLFGVSGANALGSHKFEADATERSQAYSYLANLNGTRSANGLEPLSMNLTLAAGAENHAEAMGSANSLFHASDITSRCSEAGTWAACAENIGMNSLGDNSVSDAASNFLSSPRHRANILNPQFDTVGIGVEHANGVFWIVVRFMDSADIPNQAPTSVTTIVSKPVPAKPIPSVTTTRPENYDPTPASPRILIPHVSAMFVEDSHLDVGIESLKFIEQHNFEL